MKNLFQHNHKRVNNISANQNYLSLGDRMGPAMTYSSIALIIVSRVFMPICINSRILLVKVIFSVYQYHPTNEIAARSSSCQVKLEESGFDGPR